MSFLDDIRPSKLAEAARYRAQFAATPAFRPGHRPMRDFRAALQGGRSLIAEIKGRAPSHPGFALAAPAGRVARAYGRGGAAALSLVTDRAHFGTSLDDLDAVRSAGLPVIAKDFIVDPSQIDAAWAAGADAVLLIARWLDGDALGALLAHAEYRGLAVLVECHDERDIALALGAGADLVGVNNRDLAALRTDLGRGERLLPSLPPQVTRVAESGLYTVADLDRLARAGADAFLIGHALLQSPDPGDTVAVLAGRRAPASPLVKMCGLTTPADAQLAQRAGADLLGLVFAESPRQVGLAQAAAIRRALPAARLVGVFRDQTPAEVLAAVEAADLDLVQLHGHESPVYEAGLARTAGVPLIRALSPHEVNDDTVARHASAAYFLVDPPKGTDAAAARTGVFEAAARLIRAGGRVLVAGGLGPDDVASVLAAAQPFGVDVCRGVESAPGRKDPLRVAAFMKEVGR